MKKIALFLSIILMLCLVGCGENSVAVTTEEPSNEQSNETVAEEKTEEPINDEAQQDEMSADEELKHALSYGFVPEYLTVDWRRKITEKEMAELASSAISLCNEAGVSEWNTMTSSASDTNKVEKDYGALFLLLAAQRMGCGTFHASDYYSATERVGNMWVADNRKLECPLFQDFCFNQVEEMICDVVDVDVNDTNYLDLAKMFVIGKHSVYNDKPLYDEKFIYRKDLLTRQEAVLAFSRLLDNCKDVYLYVEDEELRNNVIGDEAKKSGAELQSIDKDKLPDWHGTSAAFEPLFFTELRGLFTEEDAILVEEQGFNYVRLMYEYTDFSKEEDGKIYVNKHIMKNMDDMIGWCMEHGIHVCFDLHSAPGYSSGGNMDILTNSQHYEMTLQIWDMISKRYADISPNALSYNLLNEPNLSYFTQESYGDFAKDMIATIRKNDADKMIVSDGMLTDVWMTAAVSVPCTELPSDIVQSMHLYPAWDETTSWYLVENWSQMHRDSIGGDFCQGDEWIIKGDFKAGSEIDLYYVRTGAVDSNNGVSWTTSASESGEWFLDDISEGQNGCYAVYEQDGISFAQFKRGSAKMEIKITKDTDQINLKCKGEAYGLSISFNNIFVKFQSEEKHTYLIPSTGNHSGVAYRTGNYNTVNIDIAEDVRQEGTTTIQINRDGSYSCDNCPEGVDMFDQETLHNYVEMWSKWRDETGGKVICNEFAVLAALPTEERTYYMDTVLNTLDKYEIPWSIFTTNLGDYGPIHKRYDLNLYVRPNDDSYVIKGDYMVDQALLDVLQSHMK